MPANNNRSALPLLATYTLLVIAGIGVAVIVLLALYRAKVIYADAVFIVLLGLVLIGNCPIAVAIEEKLASRAATKEATRNSQCPQQTLSDRPM